MCIKLCKTKKVKIKDGRTIIIRRPKMSDAKQLRDYLNSLIEEDAPIRRNKKVSLKYESQWLKDSLKKVRKGDMHLLVAELDGEIISFCNMTKESGRSSHVGVYGIGVKKKYRRLGIATLITKYILSIGKRDKSIKVITLHVYEFNKKAVKMYKKLGFKKVAKLEKRVLYKGKLVTELIMDFEG